jgi:hypothetical protein
MVRVLGTALLAIGLLWAYPASAQTRFGTIAGTVTDESRAALPGVTVTLTSPALQVPQLMKVTDGLGEYQFPELPVGTYRLVFELGGFGRLIREEIQLPTGFSARIDVTLAVAQLQETVTVSGQSPLVDVTNTRGGATLSKELLQTVPISNNYQDILNLTAGMVVNSPPPAGQIAMSGGFKAYGVSRGQETTTIEGIDMRGSAVPNFAMVEEVDAKTYGNTADVTKPGPAFQLIVKSGGNDFHGRYAEEYMTDRFQSTNVDAALQAQGLQAGDALVSFQDFSADLGGRIIRDTLWFYGALREQRNMRTITGFIEDPGPDRTYGTGDDVPGESRTDASFRTLKLSYQMTPKNRFVGFYNRERRHAFEGLDASRYIPHESTMDFDYPLFANKGEWQGVFSDRMLATVMFATSGSQVYYTNHSSDPSTIDLTTQWRTGESFHAFDHTQRYSKRTQINGSASYLPNRFLGGSHELKVGGSIWLNMSKVNTEDRPGGNFQLVFDRGVATQFKTLNSPMSSLSRRNSGSAYVTDTWRATRRLTVNLGLRADRSHLYVPPTVKPQGAFGSTGSYPQVEVATWLTWGPRFGVAYDLSGLGTTVLKGTYGRYSDDLNEFFLAPFSPVALTTTTYRWRDPNGNRLYDPGEVNLDVNGPDFLSVSGNVVRAPNKFELPHTHELTASLEQQLSRSVSARVLYVFTRTGNEFESINAARPFNAYDVSLPRQDPGPDGVTGTADDGGIVTLADYDPAYRGNQFVMNQYANRERRYDDYHNSIEFALSKRAGGRFSGDTSFLATKHHRWLVGIPQSPNDLFFPIDETWEVIYRVAGSYRAPYGVSVSGLYSILNGAPGQRTYLFRNLPQTGTLTVRLEPFGAQSGPARTNLNLRGSKTLSLKGTRRLDFAVDVLNVLNSNAAWATGYASGPTYGYVTTIASPRVARFNATFAF